MKNSETDTFSYYNVPIAQFADRSIRQLLEEPDNVKGLLEIADENIVARIDCNQLKEAREMPQSIIEQSFQQGEARGERRGERRGEMRVQRKNTLRVLELRFDDVPDSLVRKINAIRSLSRLDAIHEQAVIAETLADIDWENI